MPGAREATTGYVGDLPAVARTLPHTDPAGIERVMTETPNGDREQAQRERDRAQLARTIRTTSDLLTSLYSLTTARDNHAPRPVEEPQPPTHP